MDKIRIKRAAFKALLAQGRTLILPGVHDAVSAMLAERAGFPAAYIGSYATAAAGFGLPDVGLVGMDEMAAYAKRVAAAVGIPVLADAENGWTNAANLWRTVRAFEDAGVCGIHIEDHEFGKHAPVPQVLSSPEQMTHKIRAALDARQDADFLIIARTDAAWALDDVEEAIRRMNAYSAAGADMVMAPGLDPRALKDLRHRIRGKLVVTDTPGRSAAEEEQAGADVVLYYGFSLYAAFYGVKSALEAFRQGRNADDIAAVRGQIREFEKFIGYADFAARAKTYGLA